MISYNIFIICGKIFNIFLFLLEIHIDIYFNFVDFFLELLDILFKLYIDYISICHI